MRQACQCQSRGSPSSKRLDIGGADVTSFLGRILTERDDNYGRRFIPTPEWEILRKMKEKIAKVAPNDDAWMALNSKPYGQSGTQELNGNPIDCGGTCDDKKNNALNNDEMYTLPDGTTMTFADQRWRMFEPLFDPMIIGIETPSIPEMIHQTIKECDMDIRRRMYGEIYLSGGTCSAPDFEKRMQFEMTQLLEKDFNGLDSAPQAVINDGQARKPKVIVTALNGGGKPVRDAVFRGAHKLPSLAGFDKLMMQLEEGEGWQGGAKKTHQIWNYADVRPNRHLITQLEGGEPIPWDHPDSEEKGWDGDRPGVNVGEAPTATDGGGAEDGE